MKYNNFCRTDLEFMNIVKLKETLLSINHNNIIFIMSDNACKRYGLKNVAEEMKRNNNLVWIKECVSYPTEDTLYMGYKLIKNFNAKMIISIGGGSTIDFAKGLKALRNQKIKSVDDVTKILAQKDNYVLEENLKIVAVPTTAGTGAELTQWATIWDKEKKIKYTIDMEDLKPNKAIIVPELTFSADLELTISSGFDALAHAIEAYWSKNTTVLVRQLAKQAVILILESLEKIESDPQNIIYRDKQCLASVLSGLAFSATRTTACHSISYPLTMKYNIPHGIAVAMTLSQIAEINRGSFLEEDALFELFKPYGGIGEYLKLIYLGKIKFCLKDYGIKKEDLSDISQNSFSIGRMDNNPVSINVEDVRRILEEVF